MSTLHRRNFPEGFTFGSGASAYQTEGASSKGARGPSIWDTYTQRYPGKIQDGKNGNVAIDGYHRVKEDVQIMKKIGLDAYRFSISWPRLLPTGRLSGGVNREGIDYYNSLIDELLENGIEPHVTIFHWDLPQMLEDDYKGFLDRRTFKNNETVYGKNIVKDFHEYADLCFWEFGDRVKHWITFNETYTFAVMGYVNGFYPPGRGATPEVLREMSLPTLDRFASQSVHLLSETRSVVQSSGISRASVASKIEGDPSKIEGDPGTEPYIVTHNQLLCHADAVQLYRDRYKSSQKGKIGITLVTDWMEPLTDHDEDIEAAARALDFSFGWLMDPLTSGDYPSRMQTRVRNRLPNFTDEQKALLQGSYDFIGLNYYTAHYATVLDVTPVTPNYNTDSDVLLQTYKNQFVNHNTNFTPFQTDDKDGIPIGETPGVSWLKVYPEGIYKLLKHIKETYYSPVIYIHENGLGLLDNIAETLPTATNDEVRKDYFNKHLCQIKDVIHDYSVDVRGYFTWSLMDSFEWVFGYTVRFGMVYVDYNKELARNPKDSAKWFKNFLKKEDSTPTRKRALSFTPDSQAKLLKR